MKSYYLLDFDRYIKGLWYLDGPIDDALRDEREFRYGYPVELRGPLVAPMHTPGLALDFTLTLSQVPVLSKRFADAIRNLVKDHAQLIPVNIEGYHGYEVLVTTTLLDCVDEERSKFTKWTSDSGRPDKAGDYHNFEVLRLAPSRIPSNVHAFRILGYARPLIVSEAFVDAIRPLNPIGPKLELVT